MSWELRRRGVDAGEASDAVGDGGACGVVAKDEEDGVVPGDGADDLVPVLVIDGDGEGLGAADEGVYDEEAVDAVGIEEEVGEEPEEIGCGVGGVYGYGVDGGSLVILCLDEPQLSDIAGEGALCDVDAVARQEGSQSLLGLYALVLDESEDEGLALGLSGQGGVTPCSKGSLRGGCHGNRGLAVYQRGLACASSTVVTLSARAAGVNGLAMNPASKLP